MASQSGAMSEEGLKSKIEAAFADRSLLGQDEYKTAVRQVIAALDAGRLRVATQDAPARVLLVRTARIALRRAADTGPPR